MRRARRPEKRLGGEAGGGETNVIRQEEKRGVPRPMGNMLPGNSFPQICVVSVNHSVENQAVWQGHGRMMSLSNIRGNSCKNDRSFAG